MYGIGIGRAFSGVVPVGDCPHCKGSGIEFVYAGHGNVNEEDCSYCGGSGKVYSQPDLFASAVALAIILIVLGIAFLFGLVF